MLPVFAILVRDYRVASMKLLPPLYNTWPRNCTFTINSSNLTMNVRQLNLLSHSNLIVSRISNMKWTYSWHDFDPILFCTQNTTDGTPLQPFYRTFKQLLFLPPLYPISQHTARSHGGLVQLIFSLALVSLHIDGW